MTPRSTLHQVEEPVQVPSMSQIRSVQDNVLNDFE